MPRADDRDLGDILGDGPRRVGGARDLDVHMLVAFGEVGGGIADPLAAVGEHGGDLIDGFAEPSGDEVSPGMMEPRFCFAPLLIDSESIGLDDRLSQSFRACGEIAQRTLGLLRHDGVAVAAGDLANHGRKHAQRPLDGNGCHQPGYRSGKQPYAKPACHGGKHRNEAGAQYRQDNPKIGKIAATPVPA